MKVWMVFACLFYSIAALAADVDAPAKGSQEPTLYDHYTSLKHMQERLASRPLDDQTKLQPQIQRAQQRACQRLRKDHQERVPREDYRRQGGDEFLVFSLELEQWCATAR
jgi:hypothetical protein